MKKLIRQCMYGLILMVTVLLVIASMVTCTWNYEGKIAKVVLEKKAKEERETQQRREVEQRRRKYINWLGESEQEYDIKYEPKNVWGVFDQLTDDQIKRINILWEDNEGRKLLTDQEYEFGRLMNATVEGTRALNRMEVEGKFLPGKAHDPYLAAGQKAFGTSRWDKGYLTEYDYEHATDVRARNQSGWAQLGNGLVKMGVTAGTTFLDGTVATLYGLVRTIGDGKVLTFEDNELSILLKEITDRSEKAFPNYYTEEERNRAFAFDTTNFWADNWRIGFWIGFILVEACILRMGYVLFKRVSQSVLLSDEQ